MEIFPYVDLKSEVATKENKLDKGVPNGYAGLDASGRVAPSNLPAGIVGLQSSAELKANRNVANGYAGLDGSGRLLPSLLPTHIAGLPARVGVNETNIGTLFNQLNTKANKSEAVPLGGLHSQVLRKKSNADSDFEWAYPPELDYATAEEIEAGESITKVVTPFGLATRATTIKEYDPGRTYKKDSFVIHEGSYWRAKVDTSMAPAPEEDVVPWIVDYTVATGVNGEYVFNYPEGILPSDRLVVMDSFRHGTGGRGWSVVPDGWETINATSSFFTGGLAERVATGSETGLVTFGRATSYYNGAAYLYVIRGVSERTNRLAFRDSLTAPIIATTANTLTVLGAIIPYETSGVLTVDGFDTFPSEIPGVVSATLVKEGVLPAAPLTVTRLGATEPANGGLVSYVGFPGAPNDWEQLDKTSDPTWKEVSGKPTEFPPTTHVHAAEEITSGTVAAARLPSATETSQGIVERATAAEVTAGTDTTRYVSPARLKSVLDTRLAEVAGSTDLRAVNRESNGTWPARPAGAVNVLWIDLTSNAPSDPVDLDPAFDVILDPGVV